MSTKTLRLGDERGQALVLATMFMTALLGFAALTVDFGRMAGNKRQLQNGADAAALAGALELPGDVGGAQGRAVEWAGYNDVLSTEVTETTVSSASVTNNTITVKVARSVEYTFGKVVGLTSQTLTAAATARLQVITGVTPGESRAFPYAIWDGNPGKKVKMGDSVTFRSNQYEQKNVDPAANCKPKSTPTCTWDVSGNNFKGYFHWRNGYNVYINPTEQAFSQGGNAVGTSEINELYQYYQSGMPVLLPVIASAKNPPGNTINFVITSFVCVKITQMDNAQAVDWVGTIVKCAANALYEGGSPPEIEGAYVPILID